MQSTVLHLIPAFLLFVGASADFDFSFASGSWVESQQSLKVSGNVSIDDSGITISAYSSDGQSSMASSVMFDEAIQFLDPLRHNAPASFSSSFTFQSFAPISSSPTDASGLAFVVVSDKSEKLHLELPTDPVGTPPQMARNDSLKIQTPILKYGDRNVGVDVNSLVAAMKNTTDSSSNNTTDDQTNSSVIFRAWVDYDSTTSMLEIRLVEQHILVKPTLPLFSLEYDTSDSFKPLMHVGISVRADDPFQSHIIYSWDFATSGVKGNLTRGPTLLVKRFAVIFGLTIAIPAACLVLFCLICWLYRGPKARTHSASVEDELHRYTYKELSKATHSFHERFVLGRGGAGCVYKGRLDPDGTIVAVKKLNGDPKGKAIEFMSELSIISRIRHRNLVQLRGWCYEKGKCLLVYEYMANGSLDKHLFGDGLFLDWELRMNIVVGVAAALAYLHEGWEQCVLHRDVKAANVMLDESFNAHLGDFGLARLIEHNMHATMTAAGTVGYVAPEVTITGKITAKADVYSFGVLALELVCGRRVLEPNFVEEKQQLMKWVWSLHESDQIVKSLDKRIACGDYNEEQVRCVLHVGLLCTHPMADLRPTMRKVDQMLREVRIVPLPQERPRLAFTNALHMASHKFPWSPQTSPLPLPPATHSPPSLNGMANSSWSSFSSFTSSNSSSRVLGSPGVGSGIADENGAMARRKGGSN